MEIQISLLGQKHYDAAVRKYGKKFADAVIEKELQLYADDVDCFAAYAKYEWMQDFLKSK